MASYGSNSLTATATDLYMKKPATSREPVFSIAKNLTLSASCFATSQIIYHPKRKKNKSAKNSFLFLPLKQKSTIYESPYHVTSPGSGHGRYSRPGGSLR